MGCFMGRYMSRLDLAGRYFGRLFVVGFSHSKKASFWHTRCVCGTNKVIMGSSLSGGTTNSCGCLWRNDKRTHGMVYSYAYVTWLGIKQRCYNPNNKGYKNYGGRGIIMCGRWLESFENFLSDMGERSKGLTIERIDNNGNYEPNNCYYANAKQQCNNRRSNIWITSKGKTLTAAQWSKETGVDGATISSRIRNLGWDHEKAIYTPVRKLHKRKI